MKKIVSFYLVLCLVFSVCGLSVSAAKNTGEILKSAIKLINEPLESYEYYFKEGELPKVYYPLMMKEFISGGSYAELFNEDNNWEADVEGDLIEALATKHFTNKDLIIKDLRAGEDYNNKRYHIRLLGSNPNPIADYVFIGFKPLGDSRYEVYANRARQILEDDAVYTPAPDEIEGQHYLTYEHSWTDYDSSGENFNQHHTATVYGKLCDEAIKIVVKIKNDDFKFESAELISRSSVPENLDKAEETMPEVSLKNDDVKIEGSTDKIGIGVLLGAEKVTDKETLEGIKGSLGSDNRFTVFEISGNKDGEMLANAPGSFKVSLTIPKGYKNPSVYYIDEQGAKVEILGKITGGSFVFETDTYRQYIIVDNSGDTDFEQKENDGNPAPKNRWIVWTVVGAVVVGVAAIASAILLKKGKRKKADDQNNVK